MNWRLLLMLFLFPLTGIAGDVKGRLIDLEGEPIPFGQVLIANTAIGVEADLNGYFELQDIEKGSYELIVSALGYKKERVKIDIPEKGVVDLQSIQIEQDMLGLDEVVVTGTMRETFVKASPVKVEVIKMDRVTKNIPATNLMEGLQLINGVQEVNACGVCNTNSISINGLPGTYTAVLMDGTPMYGSLASVYGLNGIPTQMVDRIEIIKGPSSTLYGSEAIAGVINIITKDPEHQPLVSADVMGTSHGELFGNVAMANRIGAWRSFTGANVVHMDKYEDNNDDGFGDMVAMDRVSLFSKWSMDRPEHRVFTIAGKYYYEDRRNGVESFVDDRAYRNIRGSDSIYGESIYTMRGELFGTYELPLNEFVKVDYSMSWHDQDSYYGSAHYIARQGIGYTNLIWMRKLNRHTLSAGATNRFQYYDDNTVATNEDLSSIAGIQYIPGVFAEDEWNISSRWTVLGGIRVDHYDQHGFIPSPRLSTKFQLDEWTTFRINTGTGFKVVNLFTEDHAFVTGQRTVEITEELDPEQSWNISSNINHTHALWGTSGSFDADVYYTHFSNKITPDYDSPGKIIYSNSDGYAESYGLSVSFSQQFGIPFAYNIGVNLNRALIAELDSNGSRRQEAIQFAPQWSGVATLNYTIHKWRLDIAYTTSVTGPMSLPEVYDLDAQGKPKSEPRSQISDPFIIQNIQFTKRFKGKWPFVVYTGIQNLLNFQQSVSPLVGYNDPSFQPGFSPFFDTSYAYAPLHGREVFLGLRLNFKGSSNN